MDAVRAAAPPAPILPCPHTRPRWRADTGGCMTHVCAAASLLPLPPPAARPRAHTLTPDRKWCLACRAHNGHSSALSWSRTALCRGAERRQAQGHA
eukprot:6773037-Prymnesium_polylepis.2